MMVDCIQRTYDGGWDQREESGNSKAEQVKLCMDIDYCLHWDIDYCLHWLHLELTRLLYNTYYTWSPLTGCTTLTAFGAHSPTVQH
jgi:hypothetical protein